jgi:hypothetical protein
MSKRKKTETARPERPILSEATHVVAAGVGALCGANTSLMPTDKCPECTTFLGHLVDLMEAAADGKPVQKVARWLARKNRILGHLSSSDAPAVPLPTVRPGANPALLAACKAALVRLDELNDAAVGDLAPDHSPAYQQIHAAVAAAERADPVPDLVDAGRASLEFLGGLVRDDFEFDGVVSRINQATSEKLHDAVAKAERPDPDPVPDLVDACRDALVIAVREIIDFPEDEPECEVSKDARRVAPKLRAAIAKAEGR